MKLLKAFIRPEKESDVVKALEQAGFSAMTKWDVLGRGRQRGIQVGAQVYDELSKLCVMMVVDDSQAPKAVEVILQGARTGHPGDGRIFISEVKQAYTIRTGKADT